MQDDMDRLMETVGARLRTYRQNEGLKKGTWGSSEEYRQLADDVHSLATLIDAEIMQMDDAEGVDIEERLAI